ncbi:DUF2510 domain-containing protein [Arenivirga flava]|nr:DUF2510 domain-containing protein [Arenivirga flava]
MNDQTPLPAPGWYADPAAPGSALRYWDGATWTEHTHPAAPAVPEASAPVGDAADAEQPATTPGADASEQPAGTAPTAPDTDVPSAGATESTANGRTASTEPAPAPAPAPHAPVHQPNPSARPGDQPGGPGATGHPAPPAAPWAQGPGNPYRSPQVAQYGAPAGAPPSRTGLWIGLGIGGGVFLLLVIGVIVAVAAFLGAVNQGIRNLPAPDYGQEQPEQPAPDREAETFAMGETFVVEDPLELGYDWQLTVTDFSAEAAEAALAPSDAKAFAVLVEATNIGSEASDPWVALTPYLVDSDGVEHPDSGAIEPGLFDVDQIEPGGSTRFTLTFEVPLDVADGGTVLFYDGYGDPAAAIAVG